MQKDSHKKTSTRVLLTIPTDLLKRVDQAATQDYTSRSDIVRTALLWYLHPDGGRAFEQLGPNEIYDIVKQRQAIKGTKKLLKDANMKDRSRTNL